MSAVGMANKPIISGVPSVIDYFDLLAQEGPTLMRAALEKAVSEEEDAIKERMQSSKFSDLAANLDIRIKKNRIVYGSSESKDAAKRLKEMEYGVPGQPPFPALRKSALDANRFSARVSEHLEKMY